MKLQKCHDDWKSMALFFVCTDLNLFGNKFSITITLRKNAVQLEDYFWKRFVNFFLPEHEISITNSYSIKINLFFSVALSALPNCSENIIHFHLDRDVITHDDLFLQCYTISEDLSQAAFLQHTAAVALVFFLCHRKQNF